MHIMMVGELHFRRKNMKEEKLKVKIANNQVSRVKSESCTYCTLHKPDAYNDG